MTATSTSLRHLPGVVRAYLDAHARGDVPAAAECFTPAVVVVDDGSTYRGREKIRGWLSHSSAEYPARACDPRHDADSRWGHPVGENPPTCPAVRAR
ncbi:nuclear transport factor 2 family protein [Streptomyces sp. QTS137]